jgi:hypothetical protein
MQPSRKGLERGFLESQVLGTLDKGLETRVVPGTKVLSKRHRGSCTRPTRISQEPTLVAFIAVSPVI